MLRRRRRRALLLTALAALAAGALAALLTGSLFGGQEPVPGDLRSLSRTPFPPGSLWRTPIGRRPAVDPGNDERMRYWLETSVKSPNMPIREFGVAVVTSSVQDPSYEVEVTRYKGNLGQFGRVHIPDGTRPTTSSDGHLTIYDPERQLEWDMWQAECCWSASAGQSQSTARGDGISPRGMLGGNAANLPMLGGLILAEELRRGRIDHALYFSMPDVRKGDAACPATHNDGENPDARALPEGTHMQLDPRLDVDSLPLPRWEKTIARALQRYGMYLRDAGGSLAIAAENSVNRDPDPWTPLFGKSSKRAMFSSQFPWDRMRILVPSC